MTQTTADAVSALIKLRAKILHLANEVEALGEQRSIAHVRGMAPHLANRIIDAVMATDLVEACKR